MKKNPFKVTTSKCRHAALLSMTLLVGCAAPDFDRALQDANELARPVSGSANASLASNASTRQELEKLSQRLLSAPLSPDGAAQLALANSPAFQSALAQGWEALAMARQRSLPGGVTFSFERLREGGDLEIGRLLSVGLFDLVTLPQRQSIWESTSQETRLRIASLIAQKVIDTKQAWIRAVAANEAEKYAKQVSDAAHASAELARRMQMVGNFTKLQAARQHLFYADATARLASARQLNKSSRETLISQLGLTPLQALQLKLPERLPTLPKTPRTVSQINATMADQRIDLRLARLQLEIVAKSHGIDLASSLTDIELGARSDTKFESNSDRSRTRGYELDIRLPVFDWGATRRSELDARLLAAAAHYEDVARTAASQLRVSYGAYRNAHDQARHHRDEVVPLLKTISEENLLRYNGMLIGVFELLADAREQIVGVSAAIEAQRDFWLADYALTSTLIGLPSPSTAQESSRSPARAAEPAAH